MVSVECLGENAAVPVVSGLILAKSRQPPSLGQPGPE